MKQKLLFGFLFCALFLSSCAMLDRSYSVEDNHSLFSSSTGDSSVLDADNYQSLLSAISYFINGREEEGTIRLSQYQGISQDDVDAACLELTQNDPMGAYAVDYIKYDISEIMTYEEIQLKIVYTKTWEQMSDVSSVTGASAILGELRDVLSEFQSEKAFRISYFDSSLTEDDVVAMVEEVYYESPESAFGLPEIEVTFYPEEAVGEQRLVDISLNYVEDKEDLLEKKETLLLTCENYVDTIRSADARSNLGIIMATMHAHVTLVEDVPWCNSAYGAIVEGVADDEGMALAFALLCAEYGFECQVVEGILEGEEHFWNVVSVDGQWQHVDMSVENPAFSSDARMLGQNYTWTADIPLCEELLL